MLGVVGCLGAEGEWCCTCPAEVSDGPGLCPSLHHTTLPPLPHLHHTTTARPPSFCLPAQSARGHHTCLPLSLSFRLNSTSSLNLLLYLSPSPPPSLQSGSLRRVKTVTFRGVLETRPREGGCFLPPNINNPPSLHLRPLHPSPSPTAPAGKATIRLSHSSH